MKELTVQDAITVVDRRWPVQRSKIRNMASLAADRGDSKAEFVERYCSYMTEHLYPNWIEEFGSDQATDMIAYQANKFGIFLEIEYPNWK